VQVGRSRDLRGPYVDREGTPLLASRAGGTPTLVQNGNRWIGAGHNAVATDVTGRDWIVYHALDRTDPYLDGTDGINERPMLLDRLDWVDGWPYVRADRGPSADGQRGPVTGSAARLDHDRDDVTTRSAWSGPVRVEADLRGAAALVARQHGSRAGVRAVLRPRAGELRLVARIGDRRVVRSAALPEGFAGGELHAAVLELRGARARAEVSHARLGDPLATVSLRLPSALRNGGGRAGAVARPAGAEATNVTVVEPASRAARLVSETVPTRLDPSASDEFDGASFGAGWTWVRQDPDAQVAGGTLRWPTQGEDLVGDRNRAGVLLRDAPDGRWAVETKLTIDLGVDTVRNFQQGGLVAYVGDDLFARLSHVAIWNTRQTEFGKEVPYAGRLQYGGSIVGPPAETTWLRLTHRTDRRTGEHELRAWSSRDGAAWVKGGVWTLPRDADLKVGLVSHGGEGATAAFDYFRTYR
jgi:hypothetical protein